MTLQEILKKFLSDEQVAEIIKAMKDNKVFTAGEENLDIRYGKLKEQFDLKDKQHAEAAQLIEELKKSATGNDEMQTKIATYEQQVVALQAENEALKLETAIKIELLSHKAKPQDIDYLMFKIKAEYEPKLDDKGHIKGVDFEKIIKTFPSNFEGETRKEVDVNELPETKAAGGVSKEAFAKMGYQARLDLKQKNPELYDNLVKQTAKK